MTSPREQRLAGSFGWQTTRPVDLLERLLRAIGADASFADDVLGDLVEERARRAETHGAFAARIWYLGEAIRAVPHLAWNAVRHGGRSGQTRVAAAVSGVALVPLVVFAVLAARDGAPVRLTLVGQGGASVAHELIVNSSHPVQLAMRVFDAKDRVLDSAAVRYRLIAGAPFDVSPSGVVTCSQPGDASLRASAGGAATTLIVRCRPVRQVRSYRWVQLIAGDSAYELPFEAVGRDGDPVFQVAGERFVFDTSVARLEGSRIRPLSPGRTALVTQIGDGRWITQVSVFQPVSSLEGLRPDQRVVIAPMVIARGEERSVPLPRGLFWIKVHRASLDDPLPTLSASGEIQCLPSFGPHVDRLHCLTRAPGATLYLTNGGPAAFVGRLSLEQEKEP